MASFVPSCAHVALSTCTCFALLAVLLAENPDERLGQCGVEPVPNMMDAGHGLLQKATDSLMPSVGIEESADDGHGTTYKPEAYMASNFTGRNPFVFDASFLIVKRLVVKNTLPGGELVRLSCYNPSLAVLPRDLAIILDPKAYYVAAVRHSSPQCELLGSGKLASRKQSHGTSILIMDTGFNILKSSLITTAKGASTKVLDARLFVTREKVFVSFWTPHPDFSFRVRDLIVTHSLDGSIVASLGAMVPDFTRKRQRNLGLMQTPQGEWRTLLWLADPMDIRPVPVRETTPASNRLFWGSKDVTLHNNINPIELPELSAYLAVGHVALDHSKTVTRFSSKYVSFFMLFDSKPPFRLQHRSPPVCLPSQSDAARCETIQFIMSVVLESPSSLLVSYGVNDCEAVIARIQLADLISFIRHG